MQQVAAELEYKFRAPGSKDDPVPVPPSWELGNSILSPWLPLFCFNFIQTSKQSRASVRVTLSAPDPPTVHTDGHAAATVAQPGSLVLLGPGNTSSVSVSWVSKP